MRYRMRLAAAAVAGCATALTLTAAPGVASAQVTARPHRTTGHLLALGEIRGKAAVIVGDARHPALPVDVYGLVRTRGIVTINNGYHHSLVTPVGRLRVQASRAHQKFVPLDPRLCRVEDKLRTTFVVLPHSSTGVFRRATGAGWVHIRYIFDFPRKAGKCYYGRGAVPSDRGALIAFRLDIPRLRLR
jgi:hypothetical protein